MQSNYERIIGEWCEQTGMSPWGTGDNMHVDIENTTIGLIYEAEETPETLHVYVDLGAMEYPDLHQKLLTANAVGRPEGNGYFGLHPDAGTVVYRVDLALDERVSGRDLPGLLHSYARAGLELLRS